MPWVASCLQTLAGLPTSDYLEPELTPGLEPIKSWLPFFSLVSLANQARGQTGLICSFINIPPKMLRWHTPEVWSTTFTPTARRG